MAAKSELARLRARSYLEKMLEMLIEQKESGAKPGDLHTFATPYLEEIEDILGSEVPVLLAREQSDLFIDFDRRPDHAFDRTRISAFDRTFQNIRRSVHQLAKSVASAGKDKVLRWTDDIDLVVTACRPSDFLGFALPTAQEMQYNAGSLLQEIDPVYIALKESIHVLGQAAASATGHEKSEEVKEELAHTIADPQIRDAALSAVATISPNHKRKDQLVRAVTIGGREIHAEIGPLKPEVGNMVFRVLRNPVSKREGQMETLRGNLMEIDFELQRFELRYIAEDEWGMHAVRCSYPESLREICEKNPRAKMEVRGVVEYAHNRPRMMQVQEIKRL